MSKYTSKVIITTVSREELEIAGFDSTKVSMEKMIRLGELMEESYMSKDFYKDLKRAANKLGIPKKVRL